MLKVADLDDSRQIPGSLLAADSSAPMSDRCTGVWGSLYPSKQVGRKAEKEKRTPERLWGSGPRMVTAGAQAWRSLLSPP